jgi:hypothetical protein
MAFYKKDKVRFPRALPLVTSVLVTFSLSAASNLHAFTVTSCADDDGNDTLRYAALTAADNGMIDLTQLTCSKITLESGAINIGADYVTVVGPGESALIIDGNRHGRVFDITAAHIATIEDVTITGGAISNPLPEGGCIYSKSSVYLTNTTITGCTANGASGASGGGVFAAKGVHLSNSTISNNTSTTTGTPGNTVSYAGGVFAGEYLVLDRSTLSGNTTKSMAGTAAGGGAVVSGALLSKYSTIRDNTAIGLGSAHGYGEGGGLVGRSLSFAMILSSTIDHNQADYAGGIAILSGTANATLSNSTISSNVSNVAIGGVIVRVPVTISNSTIAFNNGGPLGAGGVYLNGMTASISSSIIADNSPAGKFGGADVGGSATITGAFNLIPHSNLAVPSDTLMADPMLSPLGCHGGATRTHALITSSPAINTGFADGSLNYDQRGSGFVRAAETSADIGAFETNPDQMFADSFDCS